MTSLRWLPGRAVGGHVLPGALQRVARTARDLRGRDGRLLADIGVRWGLIDAASRAASGDR